MKNRYFITVLQMAEELGYTRQAISRLCHFGVIKTIRAGRDYLIPMSEARRWFDKAKNGNKYQIFPRLIFSTKQAERTLKNFKK